MRFALLLSLLLLTETIQGQVFQLNGNAEDIGNNCYRLTKAELNKVGTMWHKEKINLNEDFNITFELNLGCEDNNGADGVVFAFQNVSISEGGDGGGIGFGGISPSIGIEMDTYQNGDFNDKTFDHVAIVLNGNNNHGTVAGTVPQPIPISVSPTGSPVNVEDCNYHNTSISWNAGDKELSFFYDCEARFSHTIDIVNDIFSGNPEVFWGFTSATGGLSNQHVVCVDYYTESLEDETICLGESVELQGGGGVSYEWTPATGLSAPPGSALVPTMIANPIASPLVNTTYTLITTDVCGLTNTDDLLITVINEPTFPEDNFPPACLGETIMVDVDLMLPGTTYDWSNGFSGSELTASETGLYEVEINTGDCMYTASYNLTFNNCVSDCDVQIPSAFSPNNDTTNDEFFLISDCEVLLFQVYNRLGDLVFETSGAGKWDGAKEGIDQEIGLYVWRAQTRDPLTKIVTDWNGNITLLR